MTALKYPIEAINGTLVLTRDEDEAIAGALKSALLTDKGERVLRPTYGTDSQIFETISDLGNLVNGIEVDVDLSCTDYQELATQYQAYALDDGQIGVNILYATDAQQPAELTITV